MSVFDHVILNVSEFERSVLFYGAALQPLGLQLLTANADGFAVFGGGDGRPSFWIARREPVGGPAHVAFAAPDRAAVDAFHGAALAAGGRDNGEPGPRPHYHEGYYGAFALDPDGNNIEAVFHGA